MKVVILNKSDATGGAAVVSRRLMEALRQGGVDARMLVCEKLTDSDFIQVAGNPLKIKWKFLLERLKIFIANRFNRNTLFKIDTGEEGLPLWRHPWVEEADAILINWVNQGMLSLKGFEKILAMGKPVIWTMHDMWNFTGICHHAGTCRNYQNECGNCPLLQNFNNSHDLSYKIWKRKNHIYNLSNLNKRLAFVAVSNWLKERTDESSLLKKQKVEVIPNAFPSNLLRANPMCGSRSSNKVRILFGAARLDDPIKGLDTLRASTKILKDKYPEISENMTLALFGAVKNPESLDGFALPLVKLGVLNGEEAVGKAYKESDILVSASSYETLPGTLVEAQAYGCVPVSFNQGGQKDIVENGVTGFIAIYDENLDTRAENLAQAIIKAYNIIKDEKLHVSMVEKMHESVKEKFSYQEIARKYITLIQKLSGID